ncbi:MAG: hypothetical protein EA402_05160 [Planctomycetota bacterium]|nr:MAG: hypothetical protein EA402_05160 [Planctomycetota bacterium]
MFTQSGLWKRARLAWTGGSGASDIDEVVAPSGPRVEIPAPHPLLSESLAATTELGRNALTTRIKALRKSDWERLHSWYLERINEVTGFDLAVSLTSSVDAILGRLIERAVNHVKAPADWQKHLGFFALGGYGRAEFNPHSDLDVMVIVQGSRVAPWISALNAEFQTLLWDCGFQVGASMRSISELDHIIREDFVTGTALLEHRPLAAAPELIAAVAAVMERFRQQRLAPFLLYKVEELQARRRDLGSSIFTMEPNLKTAPGGLRDIQFLRNLAFMLYGSRTLHALRELDTIESEDVSRLFAANDHLLGIRSLLHFHHGHRHDQFLLADQLRCAEQLGYGSRSSLREVETLMRGHYRKMVMVDQVVRLSIDRIRSLGHLGPRRSLLASRRPLCDGFVVIDGAVYASRRDFLHHPQMPRIVLSMAQAAQRQGVAISISLQRSIAQYLESHPQIDRRDPEAALRFKAILTAEGRVAPILRDLHGAGFLGAYLPEFGRITCHMQFDAYHHYTVDEHTLVALDNLDAIARCDSHVPALLRQLYTEIHRSDLLALSLLIHDLGKHMGSGHVARGELMVGPIARRLGLDDEEQEIVRFLVREHVTLSNASRSRDFTEPSFLNEMAERIGSVERLDLLYCLTWPDAKAVGPKVLSAWQEGLIEECYLVLRAHMSGRLPSPANRRQAVLDELIERGVNADSAQLHLSLLPGDYVHQVRPLAQAAWHYQLLDQARAHRQSVAMDVQAGSADWTLCLAMPDRSNLLADVASVCSGHGLDIHGCRAWVTRDQLILMSLRLTGIVPAKWDEEEAWAKLYETLAGLATSRADQEYWIERRRHMILPERRADSHQDTIEVKADDSHDEGTVIDVSVKDSPGILAVMCQAIADFGCRIDFAQVSTLGDRAVDVFYISADGQKLSPPQTRELCHRLHESLMMFSGTSD